MPSQQDALALRRSGLVSGFNPPDVPRELRDTLVQPINGHKASDNVVPLRADVATRLTAEQYAEHFGGTPLAVEDVTRTADEPSLARPLASTVAKVDTSPDDRHDDDEDAEALAAELARFEAMVGRAATDDERRALGF